MIDYKISNWNLLPNKYLNYFEKKSNYKTQSVFDLNYNCLRLYAMFKHIGINKPNGIYTIFKNGLALDNPIWWDFVVESEQGFVHIVRTCKQLEVVYYHENPDFNIDTFFRENLREHKSNIDNQILKFEKHIVYINHYKSYSDSVSNLLVEIKAINLSEPTIINGHVSSRETIDKYSLELETYTNNLITFHPKAKSLLLNTAFMVESFINIIIRICAKRELLLYPDVLKKYLNYNFTDKLQNIKFYTSFFKDNIDFKLQVVKDILELMSVRNKYIHFDEYSKINIIGEEYFDGEFPLFNLTKKSFQIDLLNKTYLNPSREKVEFYLETAYQFQTYIWSLINEKYVDSVKDLIQVNPLSYNTKMNVYSSIFPNAVMEFYVTGEKK